MTAALLVQLNIKTWSARKLDKTATKFTNDSFKAAADAGRFNKLLVAPAYLKPITTAISRIRDFHYANTLNSGGGLAVLPTPNYLDYTAGLGPLIDEFNAVAKDFQSHYAKMKSEAQNRLQNLYNADDYPDTCDFSVETRFLPLPDNEEWRKKLDIVDNTVGDMLTQATEDIKTRLKLVIDAAYTRIEAPGSVFRQALLDNCHNMIELIPKLNFTNDETITTAIDDLKTTLAYYTAADVRADNYIRSSMAKQLKSICDTL